MSQNPDSLQHLYTVVLAGGAGTRFWPASRRLRPKQLLALSGEGDSSLIAETVRRVEALCPPERVLIATGAHLIAATEQALPWLPKSSFLGEPQPKNTAPCIAWAAAVVARRDPDAYVMVLPSDHHVSQPERFREVLRQAVSSAASAITTVGIQPTRPETGYGYIEQGAKLPDAGFEVARFVEKPNRSKAEEYIASGRYLWNSGMFFFRAAELLDAVQRFVPEVWAGIQQIEAAARLGPAAEAEATRAAFQTMPSISIDYAVMEKVSKLHVIPGSFGWSDIGAWESAWELWPKDASGNSVNERAVYVDAKNNLVLDLRANKGEQVTALVGVENLVVVQTEDATLVIPRERSQDVRQVVEELTRRKWTEKI